MESLDLPTEEAPRRLIVLVVEPAHEVGIDYEGEFALWEVRAVLDEALDKVMSAKVEQDAVERSEEGDEPEEKGLE